MNNDVRNLCILLVDDDEDDYLLLKGLLNGREFRLNERERLPYWVEWVSTYSAALEALTTGGGETKYDVCFVDFNLGPQLNGLDLLEELNLREVSVPLIILTGDENPRIEIAAAQAGAADYLVKRFINGLLLERSIRYALERKRTERQLKEGQARLEELVRERTQELLLTNQALRIEIQERLQAEAALRDAKATLEVQVEERTHQLKQTNEKLKRANLQLNDVLSQLEGERARLSTIIANAPGAIVVADQEGQVLFANPAADILFGPISVNEDLPESSSVKICYPDGTPFDREDLPLVRSALKGETQINLELQLRRDHGRPRSVLVNAAPILDRRGGIAGAIGLYQDITSRKVEEERARANAMRVEVQRRLMEYREKERLHIAQELHDGPIQDLLATGFALHDAQQTLSSLPPEAAAMTVLGPQLTTLQGELQKQVRRLRAFIGELRPPAVLAFGLEKALRSYFEEYQHKYPHLKVHKNLQPDNRVLPEDLRLALFRICQELATNTARHAHAQNLYVELVLEPDQVVMEIRDDGTGFNLPDDWLELARKGHFGLVGVQERANAVGGYLDMATLPGQGTRVQVIAPRQGVGETESSLEDARYP